MFTPGPDGAGLAGAAGADGPGAGADVAARAVSAGAPWLAAGDGRGHSRKAPRPARASTMTMNAILRCADVWSMGPDYFRRRIGRSQNGLAGSLSPGCSGGDAGAARPGEAGHGGGLSLAAFCPGERVKDPPLPHKDGAA